MKYQIDGKTYIIDEKKCMESYPCCHDVTIIDDNGKKSEHTYDGPEIYSLLSESNNKIPKHFMEYKDFKGFGLYD